MSVRNFTGDVLICRVRDGCLDAGPHYGLELARLGDLPSDVTTEAKRITNLLADKETERQLASTSSKVIARRKTLTMVRPDKLEETNDSATNHFQLASQLKQALLHSALPSEELARFLLKMQNDALATLDDKIE